ncbi:hypothetical protein VNO78_22221 [Psophocarpus tetragonolobus]|uniref:F-box domain-containing protein n=1 Tax=Psophocarpus tetragonolobus TaxID=3891 RepID=A0AAN9SD71_PSOTE
MGQQTRRDSYSGPLPSTTNRKEYNYCHHHCHHHHHHSDSRILELINKDETNNLVLPFDKLERLSQDDIRECAYEIFFTACRSSPGFGGRQPHSFYWNNYENEAKSGNVVMSPKSKVKRVLGLKMLKRSPSRRMVSGGSGGPSSPPVGGGSPFHNTTPPLRPRRPMTSAEIMRQQMRVTEHNDNRLRKTLTRTLVGQAGRRAETIILPFELLRHVKPSEFNDSNEYHMWQKRQLRVLEVGLLTHPSIPIEKPPAFALRLRDIIRSSDSKPIDTGKNSDTLRTLSNSVVSLAWRSSNGTPTDACHWADGFPLNIHLYTSLLQAIFDFRDDTLVLDEVDELLELMKKTWSILGITGPIHNVCFTWVLFQQYVTTGQIEPDLLCASHVMLNEVANDAKKERESLYVKLLTSVLSSMLGWAETRLVDYHEHFQRGNIGQIESILPVVLSISQILGEDLIISDDGEGGEKGDITIVDSSGDRVDYYIRSTIKNAFDKVIEAVNAKTGELEIKGEFSEVLLHLAQETEDLAMKERENFTPMLKKWHPAAGAVAAMMLHSCYGHVLRQYLAEVTSLTHETVEVLQRAEKVEKVLLQMVVEDSGEGEDNAKTVMREMVPYEVDSIILNLVRKWVNESLCNGKECLQRAKETETWNPKSKGEPYAPSAAELVKAAKTTVEEFFKIPIGITEDIVQELADGLESLFQEYIMFVAACGTKQSYIPTLPPLTRCNRDSKFIKLWKKASPCGANISELDHTHEGHHPRPSTSRGTQRLYVRLNTLHYLLTHINTLEKSLSHTPGVIPSSSRKHSGPYFEILNSSIPAACQHVSEVAAYRLIFLDSNSVFYGSLYVADVANARIKPALRILKQNITLMTTLVTDRAQALAMKEVMKASFDAFLMVLLAGGSSRVFNRSDHVMIQEDFESLNRVFCTCGEGLIAENLVEREAAVVEGVIELMGQYTEQLMEDFSIVTCETSGIGVMGNGNKLPMPPTTGRWNRSDPNTILRVLCHRNDRAANLFLKRTFQLAKRSIIENGGLGLRYARSLIGLVLQNGSGSYYLEGKSYGPQLFVPKIKEGEKSYVGSEKKCSRSNVWKGLTGSWHLLGNTNWMVPSLYPLPIKLRPNMIVIPLLRFGTTLKLIRSRIAQQRMDIISMDEGKEIKEKWAMKTKTQKEEEKDTLSELPDCVLIKIMNFMKAKDAVQTCVLSKRWKDLWKSLTTLSFFDRHFISVDSFKKFISKVLSGRDDSISVLNLHLCAYISASHPFNRLMKYAVLHNIQHLTIQTLNIGSISDFIDPLVYSCPSLKFLDLSNFFSGPPLELPKSLPLPALESLLLANVSFTASDNGCAEPFSTCKSLDTLGLQRCFFRNDAKGLLISNSNLSRLNLYNTILHGTFHYQVVLSTPNLNSLSITDHSTLCCYQLSSTCNLSFLEEGNMHTSTQLTYSVIISWLQLLTNVKILTLSSATLKIVLYDLSNVFTTRTQPLCFVRLETLKVEIDPFVKISDEEVNRAVEYLLQNSPLTKMAKLPNFNISELSKFQGTAVIIMKGFDFKVMRVRMTIEEKEKTTKAYADILKRAEKRKKGTTHSHQQLDVVKKGVDVIVASTGNSMTFEVTSATSTLVTSTLSSVVLLDAGVDILIHLVRGNLKTLHITFASFLLIYLYGDDASSEEGNFIASWTFSYNDIDHSPDLSGGFQLSFLLGSFKARFFCPWFSAPIMSSV